MTCESITIRRAVTLQGTFKMIRYRISAVWPRKCISGLIRAARADFTSPIAATLTLAILTAAGLNPAIGQEQAARSRVIDTAQSIPPLPPAEQLPAAELEVRLTLDDLQQMALVANPAIIKASALIGAARGNWVQVGLRPNPAVGYDGQQIGSGGRAEQHGIMFNQEFVRGGKLRLNRAVADQELQRAQQDLAVEQQKVLTDVRIAFYEALLAQRQIDLTNNLVSISRQGAKAVDNLFRGKEATRADVLQAQLEVENAQVLATNGKNRLQSAWRTLSAVVGSPQLPLQALDGDAYAPPLEIDFQQSLTRIQSESPELAGAMTDINRARSTLERARVEPIPNVSVLGLVNVIDKGIGNRPDGAIGLSMPIPVFNRNQGTILKAQHEIVAAERNLQQLELGLESRLAAVYEQYSNARNQVERYRDAILPAAEESLELTRKMYIAGEAGFLALLTAQRTFSQTNLNYLEALRALRTAEAEIEGLLLRGSLNAGNSR